jgi:hypothetical protein
MTLLMAKGVTTSPINAGGPMNVGSPRKMESPMGIGSTRRTKEAASPGTSL